MNIVALCRRVALLVGTSILSSSTLLMAQAGSLDPTFGSNGIVTTPNTTTGCGQVVNCTIAIQSDGKIVVAGSATASNGALEIALARYSTDGSLDSSFGNGGIVTTSENNSGPAFAVALQSDGKIVVGAPGNLDLLVIRYNSNGSLDTTFGAGGTVEVESAGLVVGSITGGIAVLPSGKVLVAAQNVLVRLLPNGQPDSSFGTGGTAPLITRSQTMAPLLSGRILVASSFAFTTGGVARYNSNGSLDATFGANGQSPNLGPASALVPLSNGKFIVAGTLASAAPPLGGTVPQGFALVRYNSNGTIDTTFGTHGAVVTPFPGNNYSAALAVAVESNGDVVAAGETAANNPVFGQEPASFALARYTVNGQLDTTFGTNGLVTTAFDNNTAFVSALAIQADGKIVAVGSNTAPAFGSPSPGFTLARYLAQ